MTRILGIDPGLRFTGWGVVSMQGSRPFFCAAGRITPPVKAPLAERLHLLHQGVGQVVQEWHPHEAAIEQTFVSSNAASSLKLGNARGALLLSLAINGLAVHEYDATLVKKSITGAGRAGKGQISAMVQILLPNCGKGHSEDAYDALAIALTHGSFRGFAV